MLANPQPPRIHLPNGRRTALSRRYSMLSHMMFPSDIDASSPIRVSRASALTWPVIQVVKPLVAWSSKS
jgi:hypothetical protein